MSIKYAKQQLIDLLKDEVSFLLDNNLQPSDLTIEVLDDLGELVWDENNNFTVKEE